MQWSSVPWPVGAKQKVELRVSGSLPCSGGSSSLPWLMRNLKSKARQPPINYLKIVFICNMIHCSGGSSLLPLLMRDLHRLLLPCRWDSQTPGSTDVSFAEQRTMRSVQAGLGMVLEQRRPCAGRVLRIRSVADIALGSPQEVHQRRPPP